MKTSKNQNPRKRTTRTCNRRPSRIPAPYYDREVVDLVNEYLTLTADERAEVLRQLSAALSSGNISRPTA